MRAAPLCRVLRMPPMVLVQPMICSMRLRTGWLIRYPRLLVVRPSSPALRRLVWNATSSIGCGRRKWVCGKLLELGHPQVGNGSGDEVGGRTKAARSLLGLLPNGTCFRIKSAYQISRYRTPSWTEIRMSELSAYAIKGAEPCGSKPTCFGLDWPSSGRVLRSRGLPARHASGPAKPDPRRWHDESPVQASRVTRSPVGN